MGHFDSGLAALRPWKVITDAAEQAHDLQKKCPQLNAYGLKTKSYHITSQAFIYKRYRCINIIFLHSVAWKQDLTRQIAQVRSYSSLIESGRLNIITAFVTLNSHEK
jgi:hypothetical protein